MKISYLPNYRKIIELIAYILTKAPLAGSIYVLKIIYFSDKYHIEKYGIPITGDAYYRLKHGPVASVAYDILKGLNNPETRVPIEILTDADTIFTATHGGECTRYISSRDGDMDYFSESNIECIEESILFANSNRINSDYNISEISHDERCWIETEDKEKIDYALIPDNSNVNYEEIIKYMYETSGMVCP